jgi:hypothetical protein
MRGWLCLHGWHKVVRIDWMTSYGPHLACEFCGKLLGLLRDDPCGPS